jgi:hypothetical protein
MAVELLDCLRGILVVLELDERETAWTTGLTVEGEEYVLERPDLAEKPFELLLSGVEREVAYEQL